MDGPGERELQRAGRRYSAALRIVVIACASVLALFAVPPERIPLTLGVVVTLNAWSAAYLLVVLRGAPRWLLPADTGVIAAVCLTVPWTEPPNALYNGTSWVLVAVSITVVAHQWHTPVWGGFAIAVVTVAAYLVGAAVVSPVKWVDSLPMALWTFAEATLSRGLYLLVRRGARAADRLIARDERTRREASVAAARRADRNEYLAALHDTAAATMLAVGTGMVKGSEPWLADQASGDLEAIAGRLETPQGEVDLAEMIAEAVRRSRVRVDWQCPSSVMVPATPGVAMCRAVQEALVNVARHADVDVTSLVVRQRREMVVVEVVDQGRGFEPGRVPKHRRGLSASIIDRMAQAGGRATIYARAGHGTRVRLEWPHE